MPRGILSNAGLHLTQDKHTYCYPAGKTCLIENATRWSGSVDEESGAGVRWWCFNGCAIVGSKGYTAGAVRSMACNPSVLMQSEISRPMAPRGLFNPQRQDTVVTKQVQVRFCASWCFGRGVTQSGRNRNSPCLTFGRFARLGSSQCSTRFETDVPQLWSL